MRALSASVILSSIALGSCLTAANAQDTEVDTPSAIGPAPYGSTVGNDELPQDLVPQPSLEFPGISSGITLGELYTDNLTLASRGEDKESSWVTEIKPFIKAAHSGARFSSQFNYTLTGYLYSGQSRRNQAAHDLNTRATLAIVPQHLFIDGTALYGRQVVNNELPSGSGTFFLTNNRANVSQAMLSPYWLQDLGKLGTMSVRYSYGRVMYDTKGISSEDDGLLRGIPDTTSNTFQFGFVSPQYETWSWKFDYSNQRIDPDFGPGSRFAIARLGTAFKLSDSTRLLANVGKESRFVAGGRADTIGAAFWNVGVEESTARNNFRVMVGHRFYGRSYQFSWTRSAALLKTDIAYVEQPTDLNQQLLGQGAGFIPPIGVYAIPSLREQRIYLMKRGTASVTYQMPNGTLRLSLYDERRTYLAVNGGQDRVKNADVSWSFKIGAKTTVTPTYAWQHYQHEDGQTQNNQYVQLALVHQFNPRNFGSVRLRHDSSTGEFAAPGAHGYRANVIFLQITHLF